MQVNVAWGGNVHFKAENSSGHQVPMDGPEGLVEKTLEAGPWSWC